MHRTLWVQVAHSSFIEGSPTTKNTASAYTVTSFTEGQTGAYTFWEPGCPMMNRKMTEYAYCINYTFLNSNTAKACTLKHTVPIIYGIMTYFVVSQCRFYCQSLEKTHQLIIESVHYKSVVFLQQMTLGYACKFLYRTGPSASSRVASTREPYCRGRKAMYD